MDFARSTGRRPDPAAPARSAIAGPRGVRTIFTLTESPLFRYEDITPAAVASLGLAPVHHGFADQQAPPPDQARAIVAELVRNLRASPPVYLHCFGGIGRTGTILHLLLIEAGLPLAAARALIARRRPVCLRLTPPQEALVAAWRPAAAGPDEAAG